MEIAIQTMTGYDETLRLARWCERSGISTLAVADHYLAGPDLDSPAFDQLVLLGGIARETSTLGLATLVSPLTFRHPAVHLKAAITLDAMSNGRFSLGIGAGWMEEEHDAFGLELYPMSERFERLEETLAYLRAATSETGTGFEGRHYRLAGFTPRPTPSRFRLVIGGVGARRTPNLAGRYADEFNLAAGEVPLGLRIDRARASAAAAGRDPDALMISMAFPALIGADEANYRERLEVWARRRGSEPGEVEQRLGSLSVPFGPPERFAAGLSAIAAGGVERIYLQVGADVDAAIEQAGLVLGLAASS